MALQGVLARLAAAVEPGPDGPRRICRWLAAVRDTAMAEIPRIAEVPPATSRLVRCQQGLGENLTLSTR